MDEVKDKLQYCIDVLSKVLGEHISRVIIIPLLYADRHDSMAKRAVYAYKIKCPHNRAMIITLLNNGDDICKALKCLNS